MKTNAVQSLMSELCIYGGLLATRGEVYEDLRQQRSANGKKLGHLMIDRLVWKCKPASELQAQHLRERGMTLASVRQKENWT